MKRFTITIIALLVAGLWFLPVERVNAQSEREQVEREIDQAAFEVRLCSNRIDRIQKGLEWIIDPEERDMAITGGAVVPRGRSSDPEKEIDELGKCIERANERLKSLRERLAKLPPAPITKDPRRPPPEEDPARKKLLEDIAEVQRLAAEYGKRLSGGKKRAKQLQAKPGFKVKGESADGLLIGTFTTPYGDVKVFLTDDWRVGDITTTTIKLEPSGQTEAERAPNLSKLARMSIEYQPQLYFRTTGGTGVDKLPEGAEMVMPGDNVAMTVQLNSPIAMEKGVRFAIGDGGRTESVDLTLKGEDGEAKAVVGVPVGPKENKPDSKTPDNTFPKVVQGGSRVEIRFPSRDDAKIEVTIGGQTAQEIAGSPRKRVVACPDNVTGPVEIIVKEGNVETKGTTRVVNVRLSAPKTNLMKGEKTTATIEVSGLEGIQKDVPLKLESTGVINMEGGNFQNLLIHPKDVQAGGRFTTTRTITGLTAGGFGVTATVIVDRYDMCVAGFGGYLQWLSFTGEYRFRRRGGSPAGGTQTGGTQTGGTQAGGTQTGGTQGGTQTGGTGTGEITGTGKMVMKGCIITLTHNAPDRRVFARLDACNKTGSAEVQVDPDKTKVEITDSNTADNTCGSKK